ncbi:MAG: methionine--tRNA ligase, partial [Bacteroidota bacterium]
AKKEGISPRAIIDKYHELNKGTFQQLGVSFDYYHRTSEQLHHETSQEFFLKLYQQGDQFEVREQEQYYDEKFDQFLADRYIKGTCPNCGFEEAYGDQCENCGKDLSPTELINPQSTLSGEQPILRRTKHWYFKLDKHSEWLTEWIENGVLDGEQHHDAQKWKKHVLGQCLGWLKEGLQPRAITRDLDWGIKLPIEDAEGKVLYVWFDAPIGYISSTRQWALENDKDWESYWKGEDTQLIHFIGKDNIVFHCIIFPAMLKAHGDYNLPINVPANQFLNFEGEKFSKSRGWGVEQHEYLEEFKDFPNAVDAIRWALVRNLPENRDADFKWDEFVDFHDKELADKLGNFINRVIVLTHKYFGGTVPESQVNLNEILAPIQQFAQQLTDDIEGFSFKQAAFNLVEIASWGNTYLQDQAPWSIAKENPEDPRIADILYVGLQITGLLAELIEPFLPFIAPKLRALVGKDAATPGELSTTLEKLHGGEAIVAAGQAIGQAAVLFPKIIDRKDDSRKLIVERQKEKLAQILAAERGPERPPVKEEIVFDDFTKLDLRTATITAATKVPKADKLLQLTLDVGFEERTVLSGIAQHYEPEAIIGQQVVLVANLAPRKMRGVLSQGMVLMAENEEGKLVFVSPSEGFGNGWVVR